MAFERLKQLVADIKSLTAPDTAAPTAISVDAAPAPVRADLIEIKVNGLDQAKQSAVWLTKGLDRSQPAVAVRLTDCTSDHLKNIVATKPNLSPDYLRVIVAILEERGESLPDASDLHPDFAD